MTIVSSKWTSSSIRRCFIDYFVNKHGHKFIPSSSVVSSDPSLLFVNAGMNQFKDIFIGNTNGINRQFNDLKRAVSSQKCIRTGGKHNDLDVVGYNLRHHTFFEMLGNWSFNDYFKVDACSMALDLIKNVYKVPLNRLIITYFAGDEKLSIPEDEETKEIWLKLGLPQNRVVPLGAKENFWEMGESGPCGVCSEIHFQLDPLSHSLDNCLEIWNLVFMQYNKDLKGNLSKLSSNHVDTGMGLERMTSVMNGVFSNYDTDLFQPLFKKISKITNSDPYRGSLTDQRDVAYRIIADHLRMITISLADGLEPGTKDAGRHFRKLFRKVFIHLLYDFNYSQPEKVLLELAKDVSDNLGDFYSEVPMKMESIKSTISKESVLANEIIKKANNMFNKIADRLDSKKQSTITGDIAFELFLNGGASTFMIDKMATTRNLKVDWNQFESCFANHKAKSAQGLEEKRGDRK